MNAGTLLLLFADVVVVLQSEGYLHADGTFDDQKFNNAQADVALAAALEAVVKKHGGNIPTKVDKLIQIIPLVWALAG